MDLPLLITGAASATFGIVAAAAAARIAPHAFGALPEPKWANLYTGALARTGPVGIFGNTVRHADGAYTRAYRVTLAPTLLKSGDLVDRRYDQLGRLLAIEKPAGTILSFRLSGDADRGTALQAHHRECPFVPGIHEGARVLHDVEIAHLQALCDAGAFVRKAMTLWVRVPSRHPDDDNGIAAALDVWRAGWKGSWSTLFRESLDALQGDGITRRMAQTEAEMFAKAEKVFRTIERESPLPLTPLSGEEVFEFLFNGHRHGERSIPRPDLSQLHDLRPYLAGNPVDFRDNVVLHGRTPVGLVSLRTPPQPAILPTTMRSIVQAPLPFRHSIVTEFISVDPATAKKHLDRRVRQLERSATAMNGSYKPTPEAARAMGELRSVRNALTTAGEALVQSRLYCLVYGPEVTRREEYGDAVKMLNERCELVVTMLRSLDGADAVREEAPAVRALYETSLVGEATPIPTGREIDEVADSLACLVPTEDAWEGSPRNGHTVFGTASNRLCRLNLFDSTYTTSPVAFVLGSSGSGKSFLVGGIALDALACIPDARVVAVDFGDSYGHLVDLIGGRQFVFSPEEVRAINIWDYPGIDEGTLPDEIQVELVVEDLLRLAGSNPARETYEIDSLILRTLVRAVYQNEIPRNEPGQPRNEPTLSHLLNLLPHWNFDGTIADRAAVLSLRLETYRNHPWLDAPTHPDFQGQERLIVYEIDGLNAFQKDVATSMAFRIASRVVRMMGHRRADGTRAPLLGIFDEVHNYRDKYQEVRSAIERGARQGRKEGMFLMLCTHAYEDFDGMEGIVKAAGTRIVGMQIGGFKRLAEDMLFPPEAVAAIQGIKNVPGERHQFLLSIGTGADQVFEMIEPIPSPVQLWARTTHPLERNARALVAHHRPTWGTFEVITWLAATYPQGLVRAKLTAIDPNLLP